MIVPDVTRVRHDPRVGGEDAVDIGVDLADVGLQCRGQRHRGGVRAAAPERGDVLGVLGDALEAGDDRDGALVERARSRPGVTSMMRARAVHRRGEHAGLRAGERPGLVPEVVDRHRQQRHRDALTRGEQHVQLPARRQRADLVGEVEQFVGRVAHRGDDDDDVVAGLAGGDDPLGHPLDPLRVGDGGTAVLLHDQCHDGTTPSTNPERADAAGWKGPAAPA